MRALYRDPKGEKIFETFHSSVNSKSAALHAERSQILALEKEVQSLQTLLKQQQSVSTNTESLQCPVCHCVYCKLEPFVIIIILYEKNDKFCDYFCYIPNNAHHT